MSTTRTFLHADTPDAFGRYYSLRAIYDFAREALERGVDPDGEYVRFEARLQVELPVDEV